MHLAKMTCAKDEWFTAKDLIQLRLNNGLEGSPIRLEHVYNAVCQNDPRLLRRDIVALFSAALMDNKNANGFADRICLKKYKYNKDWTRWNNEQIPHLHSLRDQMVDFDYQA